MDTVSRIIDTYKSEQSIRATAKITGYSWHRVVKILSSKGIIINDIHGLILQMKKDGKTISEISKETGYSERTVNAYLPAIRPFYNINPSENAKRIKRCRAKKLMDANKKDC